MLYAAGADWRIRLLMKRRREHMECESRPGLGCLVFSTKTCSHKPKPNVWKRWMGMKLTVELWWVLLAALPLLLCWTWMVELARGS